MTVLLLASGLITIAFGQTNLDSLKQAIQKTTGKNKVEAYFNYSKAIRPYSDSSLKYILTAERLFKKYDLSDEALLVNILHNIASQYEALAKEKETKSYYQKAETLARKIKRDDLLADIYSYHGGYLFRITDYPGSLQKYLKAVDLNEKLKRLDKLAENKYIIGNLYIFLEDYDQSLVYQREALKLAQQVDDKVSQAHCYDQIAVIYERTKKTDSVLILLEKAYALRKEINNPFLLLYSYNMLGEHFIKSKNDNAALPYFKKLLRSSDSLRFDMGKSTALFQLGEIYFNKGNWREAKKYLTDGLDLAKKTRSPELIKTAYWKLANIHFKQGYYKTAFLNLQSYTEMRDSILSDEKNKAIIDYQTKYETGKKELKLISAKKKLAESQLKEKAKEAELAISNQNSTRNFWIFILIISVCLITILFVYIALKNNRRAKELLTEKNARISQQKIQLEEKQKEIKDSITYARRIQYSLLAHDEVLKRNLPEHFILYKPKDIVSGDFYWTTVAESRSKKSTLFLLGDSTGHGVPGAFMSLLNISYLNEAVNEKSIYSPEKIFDYVRSRLLENMEGGKDGMDGILIKLEVEPFDKTQDKSSKSEVKKIEYAAANNHSIVIRNNAIIPLQHDKMPIGFDFGMKPFNLYTQELQKGDVLYLFTDGYSDQFGGDKGKKFKLAHLHQVLLSISHLPLERQKEKLLVDFETWRGNLEQVDDVCIIGIKI